MLQTNANAKPIQTMNRKKNYIHRTEMTITYTRHHNILICFSLIKNFSAWIIDRLVNRRSFPNVGTCGLLVIEQRFFFSFVRFRLCRWISSSIEWLIILFGWVLSHEPNVYDVYTNIFAIYIQCHCIRGVCICFVLLYF